VEAENAQAVFAIGDKATADILARLAPEEATTLQPNAGARPSPADGWTGQQPGMKKQPAFPQSWTYFEVSHSSGRRRRYISSKFNLSKRSRSRAACVRPGLRVSVAWHI
jgi:hypothetical protein